MNSLFKRARVRNQMPRRFSELLTSSEVAQAAGVVPSTVSNWRRRHDDFPRPAASGPGGADLFDADAVLAWLRRRSSGSQGNAGSLRSKPEQRIRRFEDPDVALRTAAALVALHAAQPTLRCPAGSTAEVGAALRDAAARLPDPTLGTVVAAELGNDDQRIGQIAELLAGDPRAPAELLEAILGARERARLDTTTLDRSDTRLARLVADLVDVKTGTVFDPATGEGGFLLECARRHPSEIGAAGRELNERARATAVLRLAAHQIDVKIDVGSSLSTDPSTRVGSPVAGVVCDPPLGEHVRHHYWDLWTQPASRHRGTAGHSRWRLGRRDRNADPAWLLMAIDRLAPDGRACVLQAPTSLHRGGIAGEVRRELLQSDLVEAVAIVPASGERRDRGAVVVWMLRPFGQAGTGRVLLVDAAGANEDVATTVQQFRAAPDEFDTRPGFAVAVAVERILETEEANLLPSRWLAGSDMGPSPDAMHRALAAAHRELAAKRPPQVRAASAGRPTDRRRIDALISDGSIALVRGIAASTRRPAERNERAPRHDLCAHPILDAWSFDGRDHERPLDPPLIVAPPERLTRADDVVVVATTGPPRARVESQGGRILIAPIQLLRILRPVTTPHVLAALINDPRAVRAATGTAGGRVDIRDIELPLLEDAALAELDRHAARARRLAERCPSRR